MNVDHRRGGVLAALAALLVLALPHARAGPDDSPGAPVRVVVISIDGLRPELYLGDAYEAPVLKALARGGACARAVESVYPSITYPAHASIVTGVRPARHGITGNEKLTDQGSAREWIWEASAFKAPTIWEAARRAGRKVAVVWWPSSVGADVDWLIPERWPVRSGERTSKLLRELSTPGLFDDVLEATKVPGDPGFTHEAFDRLTTAAAAHVLEKKRPDLAFVHLVQVDGAEHRSGRDGDEVKEALRHVDESLGKIRAAVERSGLLDRTVIAIVGDHGFEDVDRAVAPNVALAAAGLIEVEAGKVKSWRAFARAFGGSCFVHARDEAAARAAREALAKVATDGATKLFSIVGRDELDRLGADPAAAFALESEGGAYFEERAQGALVDDHPRGKGTHGHLPTRPHLATGFVACGPGVKKGLVIDRMRLVDIAPTLARLLGFEMRDVEGTVLPIFEESAARRKLY